MEETKIVEINNYDNFLALEEDWNNVLNKCDHTIFSTWYWLSNWWIYFGNDKKLLILLAQENNEIEGIAPLMYSVHKISGLPIRKIEFIGTGLSDYNDFILKRRGEECIKLFINYLYKLPEKWDIIELTDMPGSARSLQFLMGIAQKLEPTHKCQFIHLPKSYELYLSQLSQNTRAKLRKKLRRLEETFMVEFCHYSEVDSCIKAMDWLIKFHQKRMNSKGFTGVFADARSRNFYLDIVRSFSQKGWLGLSLIKLSGRPAASLLGFKYRSKYYAYITGFDPEYSTYGVGNILFLNTIARCIQEGLTEFDFLRGGEEYKTRWKTVNRTNFKATLYRRGFLSHVQNWVIEKMYKTSAYFRRR